MKAFKYSFAALLISVASLFALGGVRQSQSQIYNPSVSFSGAVTLGNCVKSGPGAGQIQDAGACGASAPVQSVFGRAGAVVAAIGDYTFAQISGSLAATQLPAFTGDATSSAGTSALTLATVNSNVGAFGGVNSIPSFTVDGKGRITAAAANVPAIPFSEVTGQYSCAQSPAYTGDTTKPLSSCVMTTVKVNGVAFAASPATDTVPVISAANTATYTAMPNCTTGVLQYATATHLFSCGAAGSGTVTNVATAGLASGGPITGTGTVTVTAASKSDQQAGSSAVVAVTPSQQQSHPSSPKAWVVFTGATGAGLQNFNISTIAHPSTGLWDITFSTAFANTNYNCNVSTTSSVTASSGQVFSRTSASVVRVQATTLAGVLNDPTEMNVTCFGAQ